MSVNADYAAETLFHDAHDLGNAMRQRAAVGVTQAQNISAVLLRGFKCPQGEIRIGGVAIEEVLGVIDDFFAVFLQVRDSLADEREVLFFR